MSSVILQARSFLFVPANRPERFAKALASGADAVIIDLEDAVPGADKSAAREGLARHWSALQERERLLIRINAAESAYYGEDVALCRELAPAAIVVPKAHAVALEVLAQSLAVGALVPMIETGAALREVDAIARCARTVRLAFGTLDFQADLGIQCGDDEVELAPARFALVLASRLAGRGAPIDGITPETGDDERVRAATVRARRFGFTARFCIHPRQVAPIHAGFAPSPEELVWARRVLDAAREATENSGAIALDGRMVDRAVILMAQRLIERYGEHA